MNKLERIIHKLLQSDSLDNSELAYLIGKINHLEKENTRLQNDLNTQGEIIRALQEPLLK